MYIRNGWNLLNLFVPPGFQFYINFIILIASMQDLTNNEVQYGYIKHILDHTKQAVLDLQQLVNEGK